MGKNQLTVLEEKLKKYKKKQQQQLQLLYNPTDPHHGSQLSLSNTDQQILDGLIDQKNLIQNEFNQIDAQYLDSDRKVQDLIRSSREQLEILKPTSERLNQEYSQFQEEYRRFRHPHHDQIHVSQQKISDGHKASNPLLDSILDDLEWLKVLDRIKLWFTILSDFHDRTQKLLLHQSSLKFNGALVDSSNQFDPPALEICQIITSYQDFCFHLASPYQTVHFNLCHYIYQLVQNSIHSIIQLVSNHLSQTLEDSIDWPKPARSPLDFTSNNTKQLVNSFRTAVNFQKILTSRPGLISFNDADGEVVNKKQIIKVSNLNERSILLKAILDPIILRFRFHFDGQRPTNRLDKPEWYFNHVLDRIAEHERFIRNDVQELFKLSGEGSIDVFCAFTRQLINLVERKLRKSIPQILDMKPILAHTIESAIRFDSTVKQMNYLVESIQQTPFQWLGTADVILSNPDWFMAWFEAEKGFVDEMYLEIISSNDTWEINEEDRRSIEMKIPGTNSSIRIQELIEQIKDKYFKLPRLNYQVEFLLNLQIPILDNYAQRIHGILDGFDRNVHRFISVVGAADSGRSKIYSGSMGLERLSKVYISSNWILKNLHSWNDDLFYVELFENLKQDKESLGKMSSEADKLIMSIESIGGLDVTIFSPLVKRFEELSSRAEAWIVRQVAQDISTELKPYLLKRWDIEVIEDADKCSNKIEEEMELSEEIIRPISLWKSRLSYLTETIKPYHKLIKLIKLISAEIEKKLIAKVILDPFTIRSISLTGARQFQFDLIYGWLNFRLNFADNKNTKIIQLEKYFHKLLDCCKLLSFPNSTSHQDDLNFNHLVQLCFNQETLASIGSDEQKQNLLELEFKKKLYSLASVSSLSILECQAILKRRPECWKS